VSAPPILRPPPAPPTAAFVDARQVGANAVGFADRNGTAVVTLTGPDGNGVAGTPVTIDGRAPRSCGRGCFTLAAPGPSVAVGVGGTRLRFHVPAHLRPAAVEVLRLREAYDALTSITIDERLSSGPGILQGTRFRQRAPSSMAYRITASTRRGLAGTEGIVIGDRRWDRLPAGGWIESAQTPLTLPQAYWTANVRNAFYVAPDEITFYDPTFPAWFRLRFDPATRHVLRLDMIGTAHFMHHVYSGFDRPLSISPPSR
jgi:hypothetical protein